MSSHGSRWLLVLLQSWVVVFKSEEKQEVKKGIPHSQLSLLQAVFQDAPLKISAAFGSAASNEPELNNMAKFGCKGDWGM